ncbi:hypothetical protein [Actinokineospora inagensis]|nr:hypothetical protein [Actinokineospora inagensis]
MPPLLQVDCGSEARHPGAGNHDVHDGLAFCHEQQIASGTLDST